jgi:hypothetical protein
MPIFAVNAIFFAYRIVKILTSNEQVIKSPDITVTPTSDVGVRQQKPDKKKFVK